MPKKNAELSIGFLYDDTLDSTDGVAQYVKTVGWWLEKRGHKVSYLVGETKMAHWRGGEVYSLSKNLKLPWGGNRLSISLIPRLVKIRRTVRDHQLDVLHVQVPYSPFMSQLVINRLSSQTALIATVHVYNSSWLSRTGTKLLRLIYGRSFKRIDKLLSVSRAAQRYAVETLGQNSQICPNVVDLSVFKQAKNNRSKSSKNIVFVGRLVERKGGAQLLRAFAEMKSAGPAARLVIAGDGPQRQKLQKLANGLGVGSSVAFLGQVDEKSKIELLASADIACFPSLYGESFGIVLIEAMAAGAKVVLGGNNPGYASVLGDRQELLIDPRDTSRFAARLAKLLRDERLIAGLHQWQLNEVPKYDVAVVGPVLENIYRRAIAKRNKSRHN